MKRKRVLVLRRVWRLSERGTTLRTSFVSLDPWRVHQMPFFWRQALKLVLLRVKSWMLLLVVLEESSSFAIIPVP
jgi:hypothetical protein